MNLFYLYIYIKSFNLEIIILFNTATKIFSWIAFFLPHVGRRVMSENLDCLYNGYYIFLQVSKLFLFFLSLIW